MKRSLFLSVTLLLTPAAQADTVNAAVAANFAAPFAAIASAFEKATGHHVVTSSGSTGKLDAQIRNGAPFEIFLAADRERPDLLVADGLAVTGTNAPYAIGRLALWSPNLRVDSAEALKQPGIQHIAIANPKTAPYGAAAVQALSRPGLLESLQPKLVQAENIAQTLQFTASGNAEIGFVALSQLKGPTAPAGSNWVVPADWHDPIVQSLCLLKIGQENPAARALLDFIGSAQATAIIASFGYDTPEK